MTEQKAGKGRRATARRSAEAAPQDNGTGFTDQQLATLKALFGGQQAAALVEPVRQEPAPVEDDDEAEDAISIAAEKLRQETQRAQERAAADAAVKVLIDPRHKEIFDWLCSVQGKEASQMLKEILRAAMIRERPAFREARGGGGNSSRNLAALSERLPGRK